MVIIYFIFGGAFMNFDSLKYKEEGIQILKKLISFQTILKEFDPKSDAPFGIENKKALEYILSIAEKDGFKVDNVDSYAGAIEFGSGEETLGILAHLDVVPVDGQDWATDPFTLTIKDDKFYGRGAMDDKGPLVCTYLAMKLLKDQGYVPKKRVQLIMGCDEESGSRCLEYYFNKRPKPEFGFSPDADFPLIYGEKAHALYHFEGMLDDSEIITWFDCGTRYNVVPATAKMKLSKDLKKEYLEFLKKHSYEGIVDQDVYIAYGKASHAMVPQKGLNASFILFEFLNEVCPSTLSSFFVNYLTFDPYGKKLGYDIDDEEMHELTSNVGIVKIQDRHVLIGVDCRVPLESHRSVIEKCIKKAALEGHLEAKLLSFGGYHYVDPNSFLVRTLMNVYREVTKDDSAEPMTIGGGTYAKFIDHAVAFGPLLPGREDVCHIANEYMGIEDFLNAIVIYSKAIYELTK